MRIRRFGCKRFGGIKDVEIQFKDGLNIILGPNEAGKSTLVNAIYYTLFKDSKLRMSYKLDKEFKNRFMPYNGSDFIDGVVCIEIEGDSYIISKEWGGMYNSQVEFPDGKIIKNRNDIKQKLIELFKFGEGTYESIVFAKQRDMKNAISKIINNAQASENINSILRKTVMELDGVSVDKLNQKIKAEIEDLTKKWDYERICPQNNRDINNRYKKGVGKILEAYYKMEDIKKKEIETSELEIEFEKTAQLLKELDVEIDKKAKEKLELSKHEEDVIKRATIMPKVRELTKEKGTIKNICNDWPTQENELKHKKEKLKELIGEKNKLDKEYVQTKEFEEKKQFIQKLNRIDEIKKDIENLEKELENSNNITKSNIKELEKLQALIQRNKAALEAGMIKGSINRFSDNDLWITTGLEGRNKVMNDIEFKSEGYVKIELQDQLEIEIRSGEIDYKQLSQEYKNALKKFGKLLNDIKVDSIETAKLIFNKNKDIKAQIDMLNKNIKQELDGMTYKDLEKNKVDIDRINNLKSLDEIHEQIGEFIDKISKTESEIKNIQDMIQKWNKEYNNQDELFDKMVEINAEIKKLNCQLEILKPIPQQFNDSPDRFRKYLKELDDELNCKREEREEIKEKYYRLEASLPDVSCEELKQNYKNAKQRYEKLLFKTENLIKIKKSFDEISSEIDNNTFDPLIYSFNKYLTHFTLGRYSVSDIGENLDINILQANNNLPLNLLSAGTYDGVALALRFAILENILENDRGFVVLDDCLVDLDPNRKQEAVKVITQFGKKHQVIFTTCNPQTANMLKGNIIKL